MQTVIVHQSDWVRRQHGNTYMMFYFIFYYSLYLHWHRQSRDVRYWKSSWWTSLYRLWSIRKTWTVPQILDSAISCGNTYPASSSILCSFSLLPSLTWWFHSMIRWDTSSSLKLHPLMTNMFTDWSRLFCYVLEWGCIVIVCLTFYVHLFPLKMKWAMCLGSWIKVRDSSWFNFLHFIYRTVSKNNEFFMECVPYDMLDTSDHTKHDRGSVIVWFWYSWMYMYNIRLFNIVQDNTEIYLDYCIGRAARQAFYSIPPTISSKLNKF